MKRHPTPSPNPLDKKKNERKRKGKFPVHEYRDRNAY